MGVKIYKRYIISFLLAMAVFCKSYATWSIIVIDTKTGQIGIAGASCTYSVYGIGGIIPGKGAIVVQAMSNKLAKAKALQMISDGASPEQIMKVLRQPLYNPEEQQYGIVLVNYINNPLTYTGNLTDSNKGGLTAKGISVQGNTLTSPNELEEVLKAAIQAQKDSLSIEQVLMAALEAGAKFGGDKRCGNQKASSAFLTVVNPGDDANKPYLNLVVNGFEEDGNAVERLRKKLNIWKH